jgi:hypothetical protein
MGAAKISGRALEGEAEVSRQAVQLRGSPCLAPEIQLLYKSKNPRARDQADFGHIAPRLDPDARSWLKHALMRQDPGQAWLEAPLTVRPPIGRFVVLGSRIGSRK